MTRVSIVLDVQSDGERPAARAETQRPSNRRTIVERRSGRDRRGCGAHPAVEAGSEPAERRYRFRSLQDRRSQPARRMAVAAVIVDDVAEEVRRGIDEAVHVAEPYPPAASCEEILIRIGEGSAQGICLQWVHISL